MKLEPRPTSVTILDFLLYYASLCQYETLAGFPSLFGPAVIGRHSGRF
jgi:hypothetical protein